MLRIVHVLKGEFWLDWHVTVAGPDGQKCYRVTALREDDARAKGLAMAEEFGTAYKDTPDFIKRHQESGCW